VRHTSARDSNEQSGGFCCVKGNCKNHTLFTLTIFRDEREQEIGVRVILPNYLSQSILCAAIFYGWGLGQFGQMDRVELFFVVFGIWTVQLIGSNIWLRYFRFGPAEWLWRSLTYWNRQPMQAQ